jgi:dihydroorotate dehydrogenase (NAD+) catalytic subunit
MTTTHVAELDTAVDLCGIRLRNPLVLASGVLGVSRDLLARMAGLGLGAATIKSISLRPRKGHHNPTVLAFEAGLMNAVGYSNPGIDYAVKEFAGAGELPVPVFASAIGQAPEEFARVVERLMPCGFAAVEIPLSCPHTPGYGLLADQGTPEATLKITQAVRAVTAKPIFVKVSPNLPALADVCLAAVQGGADGITAVNSLGPGMLINIETAQPVLDFGVGGVSGPALRPIAVRCVYDIALALRSVERHVPIIGVGGVSTARHVIEMMMAGASAVGIGSAVYARGLEVFDVILRELEVEAEVLDIAALRDIIGRALPPPGTGDLGTTSGII